MSADWRDSAACQGMGVEPFFPANFGTGCAKQISEAKNVCARCPVEEQCLEWALATGQEGGVWGGTTPMERRRITADRKKSAA